MKSGLKMAGCFQSSCVGGKLYTYMQMKLSSAETRMVAVDRTRPRLGLRRSVSRKTGANR